MRAALGDGSVSTRRRVPFYARSRSRGPQKRRARAQKLERRSGRRGGQRRRATVDSLCARARVRLNVQGAASRLEQTMGNVQSPGQNSPRLARASHVVSGRSGRSNRHVRVLRPVSRPKRRAVSSAVDGGAFRCRRRRVAAAARRRAMKVGRRRSRPGTSAPNPRVGVVACASGAGVVRRRGARAGAGRAGRPPRHRQCGEG